jgi:hypothetical protein
MLHLRAEEIGSVTFDTAHAPSSRAAAGRYAAAHRELIKISLNPKEFP